MFKGSFVALVTPFRDGKIDEKKIQELVEWHIAEKTDGLVPVGTTGESSTLSHKEHARVIEVVVKAAYGRVPVVAGAGSNSTAEAISLTQEAKSLGADAVLSVNPYYNRPTQEGLKAHFSAIAQAVDIPIILYNIPSRTGVNLLPSTMAELVRKNKNIVGVKEATGSMEAASEIVEQLGEKFFVMSGDDSLTLPLMSVGAMGVISVVANLVPRSVAQLCELCFEQKMAPARDLHLKLFPLIKSLFIETNPMPLKAAMYEANLIDSDELRLPLVPVLPDTRKKVIQAMRQFGIKVKS